MSPCPSKQMLPALGEVPMGSVQVATLAVPKLKGTIKMCKSRGQQQCYDLHL